MKRLLLFFSFVILMLNLFSQNKGETIDSLYYQFNKQLKVFPQEKIYLHTDKSYYLNGEKVWFRIYMIDAASHIPVSISRYAYVELINPIDSVAIRLKIRPEKDIFSGCISLPEDLPEGIYTIRSYTHFMRSIDDCYFFTKSIKIGDPGTADILTETDFRFDEKGNVLTQLKFKDIKNDTYLKADKINIRLNSNRFSSPKIDTNYSYNLKLNLSPSEKKRMMFVEFTNDKVKYRQYITIPSPDSCFDVGFFPEGGYLLENRFCNVAFKALNAGGLSEDIQVEVFDNQNKSVTKTNSLYKGMGALGFMPETSKSYYAVCTNGRGISKRFELPAVRTDVCVLRTALSRDNLNVMVQTPSDYQDDLYLLVHSRGILHYAEKFDLIKDHLSLKVNNIPSGVLHLLLVNEQMQCLSERLVFVWNNDQAETLLTTDKKEYPKRSLVKNTIQISGMEEQRLEGTFSVSVTDDKVVQPDTCNTILSNLLLISDLRGYIEDPAFYFKSKNRLNQTALDILMMTQGWRRYDVPGIIQGKVAHPSARLELGQVISGMVKGGLLSKPHANGKVSIMSFKTEYHDVVTTNKNGRFTFQGFEKPDSTSYFVNALAKRGHDRVELILDKDTFPPVNQLYSIPPPYHPETFREYIAKADQKYIYENGMRMHYLDEVTVKARRRVNDKYQSIYSTSSPSATMSEEEIQKTGVTNIWDLLRRFPGVRVTGYNDVSIRNSRSQPKVVIDDFEVDIDYLDGISIFDIGRIDILKDPTEMVMLGGSGGAIVIMTKTGEAKFTKTQFNVQHITPLGYFKAQEFYSPKYETPVEKQNPQPDLRTTIFWSPCVQTDSTGKASFEFYTADGVSNYTYIIEGVTNNGKIIRQEGKIYRKE